MFGIDLHSVEAGDPVEFDLYVSRVEYIDAGDGEFGLIIVHFPGSRRLEAIEITGSATSTGDRPVIDAHGPIFIKDVDVVQLAVQDHLGFRFGVQALAHFGLPLPVEVEQQVLHRQFGGDDRKLRPALGAQSRRQKSPANYP